MATNSSPMADDLSDITPTPPSASSGPSPYLVMQAQQEIAQGKPGQAVAQLGHHALASGAIAPHEAAFHAEKNGLLPPGTTQKMLAALPGGASPQPVPAPAGQAGMGGAAPQGPTQGDVGTQNVIANTLAMKNAGLKNPMTSEESDTSTKQGTSSTQKVGAEPGTYARGLGEIQGYTYTKNPDGTYSKSETADPNSPFQKQQSALDKLQALVKQRAAQGIPTRPADLTGLMMGADFLNKTNTFGQDYGRQQAGAEQARADQMKKSEQDFQNEAEALKEQNALYGQANTGALGIMGGGQLGSVGQIMTAQKAIESAGKGSPTAGKLTEGQFDTQANKIVADGQKKDSSLNDLSRMLALGNPTADNLSAIAAAKSMAGTSRINVQEIQSFKNPDQSLWGRVDQIMGRAANGQYTPEDRAQLMQLYQQLSRGRSAESQSNMALIHNMNSQRMNPQADPDIDRIYGTAIHPNSANTSTNLRKSGPPHNTTPVSPNQNYNGSTPLPSGATPLMKQARMKFLQQKAGQ